MWYSMVFELYLWVTIAVNLNNKHHYNIAVWSCVTFNWMCTSEHLCGFQSYATIHWNLFEPFHNKNSIRFIFKLLSKKKYSMESFFFLFHAAFPETQNQKNVFVYCLIVLVLHPLQFIEISGAPSTIRKLLKRKHAPSSSVCVYKHMPVVTHGSWLSHESFAGVCRKTNLGWVVVVVFFHPLIMWILTCDTHHIYIYIACGWFSKQKEKLNSCRSDKSIKFETTMKYLMNSSITAIRKLENGWRKKNRWFMHAAWAQ